MEKHSPGRIYLSDLRELRTDINYQRAGIFSDTLQYENRNGFGPLFLFNDEWLGAEHTIEYKMDADAAYIILPITGELGLSFDDGKGDIVDTGQVLIFQLPGKTRFTIKNEFPDSPVNYLIVGYKSASGVKADRMRVFDFDLTQQNKLLDIETTVASPKFSIGRFEGRKEAIRPAAEKGSSFFVFVVSGAFEVQGRLLHERDGLGLWGNAEIDLEALSNDAVIMLLEWKNE